MGALTGSETKPAPGESPPALLAGALCLITLAFLPLADGGYSGLGYQIGFVLLPLTAAVAWATWRPRPFAAGWVLLACLLSGAFALGWIQPGKALWFYLLHIPAAWIAVRVLLGQAKHRAKFFIPIITASAVATCIYGWILWLGNGSLHYQITSTFGLHNAYAGYLLLAWPVAAIGATQAKKPLHGWLYCGATLYLLATLVLTYSRASWVVMGLQIVALLGYAWWAKTRGPEIPRLAAALGASVVVLLVGLMALVPVRQALASITNFGGYSMQGRLRYWEAALEIFREHPLLGVGPGNFAYVYPQYQRDFVYYSVDPHSWPLQLLCELGLVGLVVAGAVLAGFFLWAKLLLAKRTGGLVSGLIVAAVGGSMLHAAFDFDYTFGATTSLLGALLAYGSYRADKQEQPLQNTISTGLRLRDSAIVLLLVVAAGFGEVLTIERYSLDHLRDNPGLNQGLRLELLNQAIRANPYNHATHYQRGAGLLATAGGGSPGAGFALAPDAEIKEQALVEIEWALELNPRYPRALALKGLLTKPPWEGEVFLEEALALDPYNYPEHYYYYASLAENDEIKLERLQAGMNAIPAHDPITPDHVRPNWYELNPLFSQWWYEMSRLTDDPADKDLFRKRAVRFKVYWDGQQGKVGNAGNTQSL